MNFARWVLHCACIRARQVPLDDVIERRAWSLEEIPARVHFWYNQCSVRWMHEVMEKPLHLFMQRTCRLSVAITRECCVEATSHFSLRCVYHCSEKTCRCESCRFAVAWYTLTMLILTLSCVLASSHRTRPWAMCSSADMSRGLCQVRTSVLVWKIRLCWNVTTAICSLLRAYSSVSVLSFPSFPTSTWLPTAI